MSIHIQLERFEGPLGLLLHLIRKEEMDIFDINIHQITRQYLDYIKAMKKLDLEVAGEFVAMAATLIHIKSRMLLPTYNEDGEVVENEDPRKELVQKLLEYQKFQDVSQRLYERPLLGRDVWARGERLELISDAEGEVIVEDNPLFSLISAYRSVVRNMKKTVHRVMSELQSISERILEIKDRLLPGQRVVMKELITATENRANQVLITFLSVLELAKMGFISVFQAEPLADIHIEAKRSIDRDVISRVEDYDNDNAAETAASLIEHALEEQEQPLEVADLSVDQVMNEHESEDEEYGDTAAATDDEIFAEEQRLAQQESQEASEDGFEALPQEEIKIPLEDGVS